MTIGKTDPQKVDRDRHQIMLEMGTSLETMYTQVSSCRERSPLIHTGELIIPSQSLRRLKHDTYPLQLSYKKGPRG